MEILGYEKLNKKAIKCMFLGTLIQFIIASTILTVIGWFFKGIIPMIIQYIILGLIILDLIYLLVSPKVRYERYRYCITKDKIDVKEGFIFTERNIDVNSINSRTSKSDIATITMTFAIQGTEELNSLIAKIRTIDSIIDIERTSR